MTDNSSTGGDHSEVEVKFADFNGENWDGSPFSHCPPWLTWAITSGLITPRPDDRDYSPFAICTPGGVEIAMPGDHIGFDGRNLYVRRAEPYHRAD